ncbi:MAG TPA: O-antigen ligase family protein [candidate division Zixibacteria bacterium]
MILGVALIGSPYNQSHNFLLKTVYFQTFIFGLFLLFVFNVVLHPGMPVRFPLKYPVLLFCGYSLLSLIFSQYKYASFFGFSRILFLFLLYFLIVNLVTDSRKFSFLVKAVIISAGLVSLIGLLQASGISLAAWIPAYPSRISSTFGNPNFTGSFLALTLPLTVAAYLNTTDKKKFIYLFIFLTGFIALLLTRSRGAIIASAFSFLFMGGILTFGKFRDFPGKRKTFVFLGLMVIMVIVIIFLIDSGSENLVKRFSETSPGEGSLFFRLKIWESVLNLIRHNFLFGTGIGTFQIYFPQYAFTDFHKVVPIGNLLHAENEYLEIWSEMGIVGLGLFLWIICGVFYKAYKFILTKAELESRILVIGLLSGTVAGLIQGLVCVSLRLTGPDFFFWLSISLLLALILNSEKTETKVFSGSLSINKLPKGLKYSAYFLIFIFTLIFGIWQIRGYSANIYLARAQTYIDSQNKIKAIPELEKAYKRNPYCLEAMFLLGGLNLELQRYSDSETWFNRLHNLAPDYGNIHEWKGLLFFRTGKFNLAEKEYLKAVRMRGTSQNHNFLGEVYASQGKLSLAEQEFIKGKEADSSIVLTQINLVQLYLIQGKNEQSIDQAERLLRMSDIQKEEKISLELLLATAYFKLNRVEESMREIELIISQMPDSTQKDKVADLLQRFAWEMIKKNENLNQALIFCDKALILNPTHPEIIYDTQGWAYFRRGEYLKTRVCFKKAVELDPENEKFKGDLEIVQNAIKGNKAEIEIK